MTSKILRLGIDVGNYDLRIPTCDSLSVINQISSIYWHLFTYLTDAKIVCIKILHNVLVCLALLYAMSHLVERQIVPNNCPFYLMKNVP